MRSQWWTTFCLLAAAACLNAGTASGAQTPAPVHPTMKVRDLPDVLRGQWIQMKPEFNSNSRCAAAFDSHTDYDHMTLKCSIYIKLGAEGARRAMRYCEDDRESKHIHAQCKLVLEE